MTVSNGAVNSSNFIYKLSFDSNELVLLEEFVYDGHDANTLEIIYYKMADGEKQNMSAAEFSVLYEGFRDNFFDETTINSGFEFIYTNCLH